MIHPTVGRVVIVQRGLPDAQPEGWPALICKVYDDRKIGVGGFSELGLHVAYDAIPLLQDDDVPPAMGQYAEWMPYQKAAAQEIAPPSAA